MDFAERCKIVTVVSKIPDDDNLSKLERRSSQPNSILDCSFSAMRNQVPPHSNWERNQLHTNVTVYQQQRELIPRCKNFVAELPTSAGCTIAPRTAELPARGDEAALAVGLPAWPERLELLEEVLEPGRGSPRSGVGTRSNHISPLVTTDLLHRKVINVMVTFRLRHLLTIELGISSVL